LALIVALASFCAFFAGTLHPRLAVGLFSFLSPDLRFYDWWISVRFDSSVGCPLASCRKCPLFFLNELFFAFFLFFWSLAVGCARLLKDALLFHAVGWSHPPGQTYDCLLVWMPDRILCSLRPLPLRIRHRVSDCGGLTPSFLRRVTLRDLPFNFPKPIDNQSTFPHRDSRFFFFWKGRIVERGLPPRGVSFMFFSQFFYGRRAHSLPETDVLLSA